MFEYFLAYQCLLILLDHCMNTLRRIIFVEYRNSFHVTCTYQILCLQIDIIVKTGHLRYIYYTQLYFLAVLTEIKLFL